MNIKIFIPTNSYSFTNVQAPCCTCNGKNAFNHLYSSHHVSDMILEEVNIKIFISTNSYSFTDIQASRSCDGSNFYNHLYSSHYVNDTILLYQYISLKFFERFNNNNFVLVEEVNDVIENKVILKYNPYVFQHVYVELMFNMNHCSLFELK